MFLLHYLVSVFSSLKDRFILLTRDFTTSSWLGFMLISVSFNIGCFTQKRKILKDSHTIKTFINVINCKKAYHQILTDIRRSTQQSLIEDKRIHTNIKGFISSSDLITRQKIQAVNY